MSARPAQHGTPAAVRRLPALLVLLVMPLACAAPDVPAGPPEAQPILPAGIDGLPTAVAIGDVVIAGQPTPAQLSNLAHEGYATVINLRPTREMSFDEGILLRASKLNYVAIPFTPTSLKDTDVAQFLNEIRKSLEKQERVLLHCSSGNRAAALWAIYEITDLKLPPETAVSRARQAGLKSAELVAYIGDYSRRIGVQW